MPREFVEYPTGWTWRAVLDGEGRFFHEVVERCRDARWPALYWECAPMPRASRGARPGLDAPIRYALLPAPRLEQVTADPEPFAAHLRRGAGRPDAVCFRSLGGDAWLVAPTAEREPPVYTHMAAFCRGASDAQVAAMGGALRAALVEAERAHRGALWLSTSGLGVHWLHVRIDTRPKYYTHTPYRDA